MANLHGDHLDWLRSRVSLLLVCGQGQWEDTTGSLESTRRLAGLLARKGIRHELDLWGYDVPHDWPSWRAQLPTTCRDSAEDGTARTKGAWCDTADHDRHLIGLLLGTEEDWPPPSKRSCAASAR